MEFGSIAYGRKTHTVIRIAYVAVVAVLAAFALQTYAELKRLRRAPVILPNYAFYIIDEPDKASVVHAFGTWYAADGPTAAEGLQTTTIECRKSRMQCLESTAMVSVTEKGFLDTVPAVFEVDRWTDEEILTKPVTDKCTTRTIRLDLPNRQVGSTISAIPDAEKCKEIPRTLKLAGGEKARSAALERAK